MARAGEVRQRWKGVPGTLHSAPGTYWAACWGLAEGSVDAVGAGVECTGVAQVMSSGSVAAPQRGL